LETWMSTWTSEKFCWKMSTFLDAFFQTVHLMVLNNQMRSSGNFFTSKENIKRSTFCRYQISSLVLVINCNLENPLNFSLSVTQRVPKTVWKPYVQKDPTISNKITKESSCYAWKWVRNINLNFTRKQGHI
jgi:hypothetical protein